MAEYYVTNAAAGGGAGTIGDPFTLAESAVAPVAAGDTVWVLAGTYSTQQAATGAVMQLTLLGLNNAYINYKGYTTVIGDFSLGDTPVAVLDATSTLASAVNTSASQAYYNRFTGFRFTGGTGDGFSSGSSTTLSFLGCRFDNNGTDGLQAGNSTTVVGCEVDNNGVKGLEVDNSSQILGCKIHSNVAHPVYVSGGTSLIMGCLFYNGHNGAFITGTSNATQVIGNTFDGGGQASSIGVIQTGSSNTLASVYNNIFFNLNEGASTVASGRDFAKGFNLFYLTTTPYVGFPVTDTDTTGTSDPFTNSGSFDYSLKSGSEALGAGLDSGVL